MNKSLEEKKRKQNWDLNIGILPQDIGVAARPCCAKCPPKPSTTVGCVCSAGYYNAQWVVKPNYYPHCSTSKQPEQCNPGTGRQSLFRTDLNISGAATFGTDMPHGSYVKFCALDHHHSLLIMKTHSNIENMLHKIKI